MPSVFMSAASSCRPRSAARGGFAYFLFVAGDDRSDEDAFERLSGDAWSVHVSAGPTRASYGRHSTIYPGAAGKFCGLRHIPGRQDTYVVPDFQALLKILESLVQTGIPRQVAAECFHLNASPRGPRSRFRAESMTVNDASAAAGLVAGSLSAVRCIVFV